MRLPLEKTFRVAELARARHRRLPLRHDALLPADGRERGLPASRPPSTGSSSSRPTTARSLRGKAGVTANIPARFQDFRVTAPDEVKSRIDDRIAQREAELAALRAENPRPKLWKSFDTPRFGAGRNARFGDLDGDGVPEMLIAQNIPRIGDNFIQISCLTAVTFDGKVLWQLGRPDPRNGLLTADTPFQIHDIDGDGRNEVVMVKDFQLQVREGAHGPVCGKSVADAAGPARQSAQSPTR